MGKAVASPVGVVRLDRGTVFVGDKAQQPNCGSIARVADCGWSDHVLGDANADVVAEHLLGERRDLVERGPATGEYDTSGQTVVVGGIDEGLAHVFKNLALPGFDDCADLLPG